MRKCLLGYKIPQTLIGTIIFLCGLFFAPHSGREHRQLRRNPCQIQLFKPIGEWAYLQYTEDISKNHPGGLKGRKISPEVVHHQNNPQNPARCFVSLFKLYMQLCPSDAPDNAFYFKPLDSGRVTDSCWYCKNPLGHNLLGKTVSRLCIAAGIGGFKTNHSLRATSTRRLYQSGVEEQQVMERTGHRSIDGVRSYKRTSEEQSVVLSDILNRKPAPTTSLIGPSVTSSTTHSLQNETSTLTGVYNLQSASFSSCNITFYGAQIPPAVEQPRKKRRAVIYNSDSD